MNASFHMNCHRVISKDVNSQISIFLFLHTKENYWNKLEGNILFDATDKRIGTSFQQINENERQLFTLKHRGRAVVNTAISF